MSYEQQKIKINIPSGYTLNDRKEIAERIVKYIKYRTTRQNIDAENDTFAEYSKEYKNDKGSGRVNLSASGDMLENLKILEINNNSIVVGYESGYGGMGKVEGNRLGTYGNTNPLPGKARDFLGIDSNDLKEILSDYKKPDTNLAEILKDNSQAASKLSPTQLAAIGVGSSIFSEDGELNFEESLEESLDLDFGGLF